MEMSMTEELLLSLRALSDAVNRSLLLIWQQTRDSTQRISPINGFNTISRDIEWHQHALHFVPPTTILEIIILGIGLLKVRTTETFGLCLIDRRTILTWMASWKRQHLHCISQRKFGFFESGRLDRIMVTNTIYRWVLLNSSGYWGK
jgi:hypothetical protein